MVEDASLTAPEDPASSVFDVVSVELSSDARGGEWKSDATAALWLRPGKLPPFVSVRAYPLLATTRWPRLPTLHKSTYCHVKVVSTSHFPVMASTDKTLPSWKSNTDETCLVGRTRGARSCLLHFLTLGLFKYQGLLPCQII